MERVIRKISQIGKCAKHKPLPAALMLVAVEESARERRPLHLCMDELLGCARGQSVPDLLAQLQGRLMEWFADLRVECLCLVQAGVDQLSRYILLGERILHIEFEPAVEEHDNRSHQQKSLYGTGNLALHAAPLYGLLRSEEHTSELQSRGHLGCRLLR